MLDTDKKGQANGKQPPRKVLDRIRGIAHRKHCSIYTKGAYVNWIRRYILFHDKDTQM